jgi:glycosyltransferase involved in cell wall biosynthesis
VPSISVVICTYNRADRVGRAINSVLGQTFEDFELIVVDDGSADETQPVVQAIDDPRVRYVYRNNGGLSAARNTGVSVSSSRYVTFLDDDDEVLPAWLERFRDALRGEDAVATCAAYAVDELGRVSDIRSPHPLGLAYGGFRGLFLSGTFALPRSGYDVIGGFADGLPCSHHAEFALRLLPYCRLVDWPVRVIDEPLLRYEVRAPERRPENTPAKVLSATRYLLARHGTQLARSPETFANVSARAGVAAARLGQYAEARRHFARAARAQPRRAKSWVRLAVAFVPAIGDVAWRARRYRRLPAVGVETPAEPS